MICCLFEIRALKRFKSLVATSKKRECMFESKRNASRHQKLLVTVTCIKLEDWLPVAGLNPLKYLTSNRGVVNRVVVFVIIVVVVVLWFFCDYHSCSWSNFCRENIVVVYLFTNPFVFITSQLFSFLLPASLSFPQLARCVCLSSVALKSLCLFCWISSSLPNLPSQWPTHPARACGQSESRPLQSSLLLAGQW